MELCEKYNDAMSRLSLSNKMSKILEPTHEQMTVLAEIEKSTGTYSKRLPRRWGKSTIIAYHAILKALESRNANIAILSKHRQNNRFLCQTVSRLISFLEDDSITQYANRFMFSNGSTLYVKEQYVHAIGMERMTYEYMYLDEVKLESLSDSSIETCNRIISLYT